MEEKGRRISRWCCDEEVYDFTDYESGGTGLPDYVDEDDDELEDHHLPSLMSGKQQTNREGADRYDTTDDQIHQQHQQSVANQAKP